jgi:predicted transport protein
MTGINYVRAQVLSLAQHPTLNEKWVQEKIRADPGLLGLGDLEVKDFERMQPRAGRLDLLLQDPDSYRRYTVELQLGATDESHIIRALEYWDIERKRYPQYDYCAVLIAEDITSRFLNVIALFNGSMPFIAIKMSALQVGEAITLVFTTVLDELTRGLDEEDVGSAEAVDRAYWEAKGSPKTVIEADRILAAVHSFAPGVELRYNKHYIGFWKDGQAYNFALCRPRKNVIGLDIKLLRSEERENQLEQAGLELLEYDKRWGAYRMRLSIGDVNKHETLMTELLKAAYDARGA